MKRKNENEPAPARRNGSGKEQRSKRYHLMVNEDVYEEIQRLAEREGVPVVDLFRRFLKLGLIVAKSQEIPGTTIVIREGGTKERERELVFVT